MATVTVYPDSAWSTEPGETYINASFVVDGHRLEILNEEGAVVAVHHHWAGLRITREPRWDPYWVSAWRGGR